MENGVGLDFEGLASLLLERAREFLPNWLPGGRMQGKEYVVGSLAGEKGQSLKINTVTGVWADFAGNEKGSDLISLYAAINHVGQGEAAKQLAFKVGHEPIIRHASRRLRSVPLARDPEPAPEPSEPEITAPPEGTPAPTMEHPRFGKPVAWYTYRDPHGRPLFYVARYEDSSQPGKKTFLPWSWLNGRFTPKGFPAPRPLYGLEILASRPEAPVMLVEGEKACEAARQIAGRVYVVMTWANGSKAVSSTDFTPLWGRKLLLWPDADEPGILAMREVAEVLHPHCPEIKILDVSTPDPFVSMVGFDAADALGAGWAMKDFAAWAKPRASLFVPKPPEPKPEPVLEVSAATPESEIIPIEMRLQSKRHDAMHSARFAAFLHGKLLFDSFHQQWFKYVDVWRPVSEDEVKNLLARLMNLNYEFQYSTAFHSAVMKMLRITLARHPVIEPGRMRQSDTWNSRRELFPMQNGVLNLETKELIPHSPDLMMNWLVPYCYDPKAECPTVRQFLKNMTQGDARAEKLAICYLWAILYGCAHLQKYLELVGKPGTGKSTFIKVAERLVGDRNSITTTMKQLSENRFETANLYGKRLAIISDADRWAGSIDTFKAITGQDPIRYEEKNKQQDRPFIFSGMIIVAANNPIRSNEQSTALIRRRLSIYLDKFFPASQRDDQLEEKLSAEMPGLLNWLVSLDREYVMNVIRDKTSERLDIDRRAFIETDEVAAWIDDALVFDPDPKVKTQIGALEYDGRMIKFHEEHLYPCFIAYLESTGRHRKVPRQDFSSRVLEIFEQYGYPVKKRTLHGRGYLSNVKIRSYYDREYLKPISLHSVDSNDNDAS